MDKYIYCTLREMPELKDTAAEWFTANGECLWKLILIV